jgi:phosphoglycolate phosphatase
LDSVLLDIDRTVVDSTEGILGTLRAAITELGVPEPRTGIDRRLLGPPMYRTLPPLIGAEAAAA